jgi:hypothetical protein
MPGIKRLDRPVLRFLEAWGMRGIVECAGFVPQCSYVASKSGFQRDLETQETCLEKKGKT